MLDLLAGLLPDFLSQCLQELLLRPVLMAAWWLVRNGAWLALYPPLLLLGWLRLGLRGRGHTGWWGLWQAPGPAALHRVGRVSAGQGVTYALSALLLGLGAAGLGTVFYAVGKQVLL